MAKKKQDLTEKELLEQALVPEDEQPYKVPDNWVWVRLEIICIKITDGEHIKPKLTDYGVPLLTAKNILDEEIDFTSVDYVEENIAQKSWVRCEPKLNDILVCSRGTIGRNTILNVSTPFCLMGTVILLRFNNLVSSKFYNYVLKSDFMQNKMKNMCGSTAVSALYLRDIKTLITPLPPFAEQQRIVDRIESLFEKLDQAKGLIQDALDSFENRKSAILHKAYTGELTKRWREDNGVGMESWEEKPLKEVVKFKTGYAFDSKSFSNTGYQVIRMGNLYNGVLDLSRNPVYISPELIDSTIVSKYSVNKGDILLTLTGTKYKRDYGYAVLIKESNGLLLNQRIVAFTPELIETNYILYYLQSDLFRDIFFSSETGGVNQGNVSSKFVENIKIPMASLVEQKEIVRILYTIYEKEQNANELCDLIDNIGLMKKAILARAFRGELGTNDPSEESAIELLKEVLTR